MLFCRVCASTCMKMSALCLGYHSNQMNAKQQIVRRQVTSHTTLTVSPANSPYLLCLISMRGCIRSLLCPSPCTNEEREVGARLVHHPLTRIRPDTPPLVVDLPQLHKQRQPKQHNAHYRETTNHSLDKTRSPNQPTLILLSIPADSRR